MEKKGEKSVKTGHLCYSPNLYRIPLFGAKNGYSSIVRVLYFYLQREHTSPSLK